MRPAENQKNTRKVYVFSDESDTYCIIESIKTTSMENITTGVLDKNKEHYLRSKDKAEKSYDVLRHIQLHMSKYKKM